MTAVTLIKWGNSVGLRIPANELKAAHAHIGKKFSLIVTPEGGFALTPVSHSQENWLRAFNAIADADADKMLIDSIETDFDKDEWIW